MKKKFIQLSIFLISGFAFSQVGINNTLPKATLDIIAKNTDGSTPEGLIAPRLTGNEIKLGDLKYDVAQTGTLVYVTAAVGTASTKTANINAPGYYYFDGSIWQKIINVATADTSIYNSNGTTGTSRTVALTDNLNFGSGLFYLDGTNSRVGVSTTSTSEKQDINGTLRVRTLPVSGVGSSNTTAAGAFSSTTTPFVANAFLGANDQGVVGKITSAGATTTNTSTAMFVIKRYTIGDNPNQDLAMDVTKWEAILSNVRYTFTSLNSTYNTGTTTANYAAVNNQFNRNNVFPIDFGWRLEGGATGNWRIKGDINTNVEGGIVDVLFINKAFVAAESRTN